jgi:hypothetical protein
MSKITELATGQLTPTEAITVELIEADETPAVIIVRWPAKPTVIHPHRFPTAADVSARTFAAAVVRLAAIKRERGGLRGAETKRNLSPEARRFVGLVIGFLIVRGAIGLLLPR